MDKYLSPYGDGEYSLHPFEYYGGTNTDIGFAWAESRIVVDRQWAIMQDDRGGETVYRYFANGVQVGSTSSALEANRRLSILSRGMADTDEG